MAQTSNMNDYAEINWSEEVRYPDMPVQSQMPPQVQLPQYTQPYAPSPYHISYEELRGADFPNAVTNRNPLDMNNPMSQEVMENPMSNAEVYQASMKSLLSRNLGYYVVATFQVGSQGTVSVPGILYTVGNDYIVLYQPEQGRYVTGDLYALKFVEFHDTKSIPRQPVPQN